MDGKEIQFGPEAVRYIEGRLALGKTLAGYLLQHTELSSGQVVTFLPSDVSYESARQFEYGGKLPALSGSEKYFTAKDGTIWRMSPTPNSDFYLAGIIKAHLNMGEGRICIFEDANARSGDPFLLSCPVQYATFNEEVYYFLTGKGLNDIKIKDTVRYAASWLFICAMTVIPQGFIDSENQVFTSEQLTELAKKAEKIAVGAYDGEGYLIWSKHD